MTETVGLFRCSGCAAHFGTFSELADHLHQDHGADVVFDLLPGVHDLIVQLELSLSGAGLAAAQQALAVALWRRVQSHPLLQATVDFETESLTLRQGGRDLRLETRVFPYAGRRPGG